jgi:K+-sensing histidine kinase KdpD
VCANFNHASEVGRRCASADTGNDHCSGVAIATVLTFPLARIAIHSRDLFFIAAIVVTARFAGVAAGLYAALLCFLVYCNS